MMIVFELKNINVTNVMRNSLKKYHWKFKKKEGYECYKCDYKGNETNNGKNTWECISNKCEICDEELNNQIF